MYAIDFANDALKKRSTIDVRDRPIRAIARASVDAARVTRARDRRTHHVVLSLDDPKTRVHPRARAARARQAQRRAQRAHGRAPRGERIRGRAGYDEAKRYEPSARRCDRFAGDVVDRRLCLLLRAPEVRTATRARRDRHERDRYPIARDAQR